MISGILRQQLLILKHCAQTGFKSLYAAIYRQSLGIYKTFAARWTVLDMLVLRVSFADARAYHYCVMDFITCPTLILRHADAGIA